MTPTAHPKPPRFFRLATLWVPTWRTWFLILTAIILLTCGPGRSLHRFLATHQPTQASILVVEGWLPDYALREALAEFNRGAYDYLVTSGGPMERGALVSGYPTYAAIAAASLRKMGAPAERVLEAPAPATYRHRTFHSAQSVRDLIASRHLQPRGLNVVSTGTHARRTLLVFHKTLGAQTPVGILAIPPQDYDPEHWWRSSDGAKSTLTELIGWLYESLADSGR